MPDPMVKSGANLGFKVGTQQQIDQLITAGSGAQHGTFYLAQNTHRLYIGNENGTLSPVNEGIITVASTSGLDAAAGKFAYVTGDNILCVYNGSQWVQINPDSNTVVTAVTQTMAMESNQAAITTTLTNTLNGATVSSPSDKIKVAGSGGAKVSTDSTGTDPILTIKGEQYTIGSSVANATGVATVTLSPSDTTANGWSDSSTFTLSPANSGHISISAGSGTNDIVIDSRDTVNKVKAVAMNNAASNGDGFVLSVTTDDSTSLQDTTKTATFDPVLNYGDTTTPSQAHFVNGVATLEVYSKDQIDQQMKALDAMHYMGTMGNGGSILNTNSIDTSNISGVTFKVGDTYKLAGATTINGFTGQDTTEEPNGRSFPANTIVIANGTEYTASSAPSGHPELIGTIDPSTLTFDIITGSSEADTTYHFKSVTATGEAGVQLANQNELSSGEIRVKEGTAIAVTNNWDSQNKKQTITVAHDDVSSSATTGTAISQTTAGAGSGGLGSDNVNVVTGVTVNSQGHVTGVETTQVTLKDTNLNMVSFGSDVSVANNQASITDTLIYNHYGDQNNSTVTNSSHPVTIKSDNLSIVADSDNSGYGFKINLVWGSM